MRKSRLMFLMLLVMMISLTGCVKVIEKGTEDQYTGKSVFSADGIADTIWPEVVADISGRAVDLDVFLTEAQGKLTSLKDKYGVDGKANYDVRAVGTIESVNTEKSAGYAVLNLDNYSGSEEIRIQVGPTFKNKDVLGDAQKVTGFKEYTNQTEWGQVKDAMVKKVSNDVIATVDLTTLAGKHVEIIGVFGASTGSSDVLIIPVSILEN